MMLGIDEVGRGPWAGPLVVGAVVLGDHSIEGLTDSKKLSKKKLLEYDKLIRDQADAIGLGWVSAVEIDELGLSECLKLATIRAVEQIKLPYHEIIIDGTVNFLRDTNKGEYVTTIKKADLLISSVSAASIVAKVARDSYMIQQAKVFPEYGFEAHVGYGTAKHQAALEKYGVTPLHRRSFKPVLELLDDVHQDVSRHDLLPLKSGLASNGSRVSKKSTKEIGDSAEQVVADFLDSEGHEILARNWRTKFCEIDIVSSRDDTVYFTEVKYRRNAKHGDGLAAITTRKLRQMKFAAEYFALQNKLKDKNLRLVAASVAGEPLELVDFVEID